jgi:hypothetical protein
MMFFVSLILRTFPSVPRILHYFVTMPLFAICNVTSGWGQSHPGCGAIITTVWRDREGIAQACLLFVTWMLSRSGAQRGGVIVRMTRDDGFTGLVLHTLREIRPVTIREWDRASRKFRLEGSGELWQTVDPIDDLVPVDDTPTAA